MAIASIAHYEIGSRIPDPLHAMMLYRVAEQRNRQDLADVFMDRVVRAIGAKVIITSDEREYQRLRKIQRNGHQ